MSVKHYNRQVLTLEDCNIDDSYDGPKGMSQFMKSIFAKSKKLAFPALLFLGVTAGSVATLATGGPAVPAVIALGTGTIKMMSAMKKAYKGKKLLKGVLTTHVPDDRIKRLFSSDLSDSIVDKMELLGSSLKEDLRLIQITLEKLDIKIEKLLHQKDKKIETTFDAVTREIKRNSFNNALKMLKEEPLTDMRIESNLPVESARLKIREALEENGKEGALSVFYYILKLRQKFEALVQLKYFLSDLNEEKECVTTHMDKYLQEESRTFLCDLEDYWGIMKNVFKDQIKIPAFLVVGKTGTGKSSLCNLMAGLPPDSDEMSDGFATSPEMEACTESTTVKECFYFGDPSRLVKIIDTPGFDDPSKNHDATIIADFVKILKNEIEKLSMIVFALNGRTPRLEGSLKAMITIIQQMFSDEVWKNVSIIFT